MDENDFEEESNGYEEQNSSYSFPGFGTGKSNYNKNSVNVNDTNDVNTTTAGSPSNNVSGSNNVPQPASTSSNVPGVTNSLPPQNNSGLTSGNKDNNNNNDENSLKQNMKNQNQKPVSNEDTKEKDDKKSNDNKSKSEDASSNKNNNTNNNSNDSSGNSLKDKLKPGNIGKNLGLGALNKMGQGAKNKARDMQGEDAPTDEDSPVVASLKSAGGNFAKFILFIIRHPYVAIIGGIIIIVLFLLIFFAVSTSSIFSGRKYGGWYCNMYSPTTSSNPGEVTSFYTWRIWNKSADAHKGIDISYGSKGSQILATHDGTIAETNYEIEGGKDGEYGIYIKIDDPKEKDDKKYRTYYAHLCSLEEEKELKASCEAGEYTGCDNNCKQNEDGTYTYIWTCGPSESAFESLVNKLKVGTYVKKGDVIGYVSDTGYRSASCDFHVHYETQANKNYDTPDEGYVAESPNRYFNIDDSSIGCDPVLSSGEFATPMDKIEKWECEKPIIIDDKEDEIFKYCDEENEITPKENRFKGTIGIKNDEGDYIYTEGLGTYVGSICGYEAKPTYYGKEKQCAAGVYDYYESFLMGADSNTWNKFQSIKGNAIDYWNNNASLGTNGFKTSSEPSAGSVWVTSYSKSKDANGNSYGHIMAVTKVEGNNVYVYECSGYTSKTCGNYTYTKDELASKKGFMGYINIIEEGDDC